MEPKFIGQYNHNEVFVQRNEETKTWTMILKHKQFGNLTKDNIKYMPKIGMAKRFFKSKIRHLKENKRVSEDAKKSYYERLPKSGSGPKVSREEIEGWLSD